jgi:hypothetical protein
VVAKVLRVPLSETTVVRLTCGKDDCGGVVEVPLSKLAGLRFCPVCGKGVDKAQTPTSAALDNIYLALSEVLRAAASLKGLKVEFVAEVPDAGE